MSADLLFPCSAGIAKSKPFQEICFRLLNPSRGNWQSNLKVVVILSLLLICWVMMLVMLKRIGNWESLKGKPCLKPRNCTAFQGFLEIERTISQMAATQSNPCASQMCTALKVNLYICIRLYIELCWLLSGMCHRRALNTLIGWHQENQWATLCLVCKSSYLSILVAILGGIFEWCLFLVKKTRSLFSVIMNASHPPLRF